VKRFALVLALLAATGILLPGRAGAAHSGHFPVTVVDDHGNHIRITREPKRLITLFPGQTEILFALGLENRIVADGSQYAEGAQGIVGADAKPRAFKVPSEWPTKVGRDYPVRAPQLSHVEGGCCGTDYNLETIEAARPDLIFAPYSKTEEPVYAKLRELGLKVIILDPSSLTGVLNDISLVGKATGATKAAKALVGTLKASLASTARRLAGVKRRPRVYYEVDATNPTQPYTAGPKTFIDNAITLAHGHNVADTVRTCSGTLCYPQLDLESLVAMNPQVIVLGDALYGVKPADVRARSGWETIAAVRSNRIYKFNDDLISRAGPRIAIGVRHLARDIHPEAFRKR
jgi:iron complex transport system substrate-binding protein